ncbi:MAG: dTDP-4-dehydrorhamnose reductase [Alistipes sp.]|nr:dTDP-4-dehydrorhamnose reductase [Alistipes sp.]
MNILVTGANGQLGNEIRRRSVGCSHHFTFTDVAELDITDAAAVLEMASNTKAEFIINCAAYTNVDKAEDDEQTAHLINCTATANLAAAAKQVGATLIHVSTDYVFDGCGCTPYTEEAAVAPTGAYGRTKLAGEQAVAESGCKHIIIRTAWLYSPFGRNFVKTMRTLTAEREHLQVVFDQVGSPTYAGDLADAILHIVEGGTREAYGTYHYSNEGVCSWYDFAKEICEMSGNACEIRPCHSNEFPSKVARPHYSVLDKTKIKTTFGISIPHWKESLAVCIKELNEQ